MDRKEALREAARRKARELRYKKPVVEEMNLEEIKIHLSEMNEVCGDVRWYFGKDIETLEEILGEDDAYEFQMSFSGLSADIERMQEAFDEIWLPEYFDDFLAACHPEGRGLMGYDEYEGDYFQLDGFEAELACREASERMQRKTKKELIECAHQVIGILIQYMGIKYRFDSLNSAFEVLMERTQSQLKAVKEIEEAYEEAAKVGFDPWEKETRKLDGLLRELDERAWIE